MISLKNKAVQNALHGDWNAAISLNQEVLKENPEDIDALNRLAFAFTVIGKVKDAKATYHKVLILDSLNPIAIRNLKRLGLGKNDTTDSGSIHHLGGQLDTMFLEENGKTKIIELINVAEPKLISRLITGETVHLRVKRLKIFVLDVEQKYIGMLPDNIGKRLITFIQGGNGYEAYVKAVANNKITIFVKETKRVAKFKNQPSFITTEKSQLSFDKPPGKKTKHHDSHDDSEDEESE